MKVRPDHREQSYPGHGRLIGKTALITGGDSGIGRAVAIAFAREGADVVISYLPEEEADAQETKHWIEEAGQKGMSLAGDIREERQCQALVEKTLTEQGRLDILVNNAPGPVWTPLIPSTTPPEKTKKFGANTPYERPGQPVEIAPLYVFLASEESSYVTGEVFGATGGRSPA